MNEIVAIYFYYGSIGEIVVYGCLDKDTDANQYDFFDLYDKKGNCLNEGEPFETMPSREEVKEFLEAFSSLSS